MGRIKLRGESKKKKERLRITQLKMSSGRVVTDPEEVVRLLRADGFTVDEDGNIGLGPKLKPN